MSEKEYKIEFHSNAGNDYVTVTEVKPYDIEYETDPNPTAREELGKKIDKMSRGKKMFLTYFLDIYGFIFRLTSNRVIGIFYCFIPYVLFFYLQTTPYSMSVFEGTSNFTEKPLAFIIALFPIFWLLLTWIIDIITVTVKNDITFLGKVKYKNFEE